MYSSVVCQVIFKPNSPWKFTLASFKARRCTYPDTTQGMAWIFTQVYEIESANACLRGESADMHTDVRANVALALR